MKTKLVGLCLFFISFTYPLIFLAAQPYGGSNGGSALSMQGSDIQNPNNTDQTLQEMEAHMRQMLQKYDTVFQNKNFFSQQNDNWNGQKNNGYNHFEGQGQALDKGHHQPDNVYNQQNNIYQQPYQNGYMEQNQGYVLNNNNNRNYRQENGDTQQYYGYIDPNDGYNKPYPDNSNNDNETSHQESYGNAVNNEVQNHPYQPDQQVPDLPDNIISNNNTFQPFMNTGETNFEGCVANGQQIPSILVPGLYDIAVATTMDKCDSGQGCRKMPVIYYHPVMKTYTMDIREFFYYHECAHHILNHVVGNYDKNSEQAADCWAIREMEEKKQLTQNGINSIKSMLQSFGQGDYYHLPGNQRAQNLDTCLSAPDFAKQ